MTDTRDAEARQAAPDEAHRRDEEVLTLQYWLANEDIYTSTFVKNWLKRTPRGEAADALASIAKYARPESRSPLTMMFLGLTAMLTTAEIISINSPAGRKAGIRAALLLANLNDVRCLMPLVAVFEMHWFWEGKYQQAIESALLRFLLKDDDSLDWKMHIETLQSLAERIWLSGDAKQDLSVRRTDLLVAALRRMKLTPESARPATSLLLRKIVDGVRTPQRRRAAIAAQALLTGNEPS